MQDTNISAPVSIPVRLENISTLPRSAWTEVAVPYKVFENGGVEATFITNKGHKFRAVRGSNQGTHSTYYRIFAHFGGSEVLFGKLVDTPSGPSQEFIASDWVTDDIQDVIPYWLIEDNLDGFSAEFVEEERRKYFAGESNGYVRKPVNTVIRLEDSSPAHQCWYLRGRFPDEGSGFVSEVWVTLYHLQDAADFEAKLTWSNPKDPNLSIRTKSIGFCCDEKVAVDFKTVNGVQGAFPTPLGKNSFLVTSNAAFSDGSSQVLSGRILCMEKGGAHNVNTNLLIRYPEDPIILDTDPDSTEPTDTHDVPPDVISAKRIQDLLAAIEAPTVGCVDDKGWDGHWLAFGNIPTNSGNFDFGDIHYEMMETYKKNSDLPLGAPPQTYYHERPYCLAADPGRPGDQEDFGSTKGSSVLSYGDPKLLWHCGYILQGEMFRGISHYEEDGNPIRNEDHPDWVTWAGSTFFRGNPKDTLGKQGVWPDGTATGHKGQDDQHKSLNMLCAYVALKDSHMYRGLINHYMVNDTAMVKNRLSNPRAIGRLFLAWSHIYTLIDDLPIRAGIDNLVADKMEAVKKAGFIDNKVSVISLAPPDPRNNVRDASGVDLPTWSVWMNALGVIGLYAQYKVSPVDAIDPMVIKNLCETILDYGIFKEDDKYQVCYSVWYPEDGRPITEHGVEYSTSSTYMSFGVEAWVMPALYIYLELFGVTGEQHTEKARDVLRSLGYTEWWDSEVAEWFACVSDPLSLV